MRTAFTLAAVLFCVCCHAADDYPVYVYPCPRAEQPPNVDGVLDDACWQQAPLVSGFTFYDKSELVEVQTSFRVVYDDRRVYFGVRCEEPSMDKLSPAATARDDGEVFRQEALEFFVDPTHDHVHYYQFGVGAAGSLYDSRRRDTAWNSEAQVRVARGEAHWSLEFSIPWADLAIQPRVGAVIGFNVCRDRYIGRRREWTNWSQTKANFHDPERFAHLVLSPTAEQLGKLGDEFRRGDRSGPLRVFSAEGFSETSYRALAREALAGLDALLQELEKARRKEADAAVAGELGKLIDDYRRQMAPYRAYIQGRQPLDAATWTEMDMRLHTLSQKLQGALWEARLKALLAGI